LILKALPAGRRRSQLAILEQEVEHKKYLQSLQEDLQLMVARGTGTASGR
jgi:hypothetical protein